MYIQGRTISLPYTIRPRELGQLTAQIQPDGTFSVTDGLGSLSGAVHDGELELTISSDMCENHWTLRRVD